MRGHAHASRRLFMGFLLGSPLLASFRTALAADEVTLGSAPDQAAAVIAAAKDAINVFDFEAAAKKTLSPAHFTFQAMGVEHELTLRANREGFAKFQLRPRRLVDVREVDTSVDLLGTKLSCPIILGPAGSQMAFNPEGEIAVARAAKSMDHVMALSMGSSADLEDVAAARGAGGVWSQIYAQRTWLVTRMFLKNAERAGCRAVVLTVDIVGQPMGRERIARFHRDDNPDCQPCHGSTSKGLQRGLRGLTEIAKSAGLDLSKFMADSMTIDWDMIDRIRDATSMNILIKGVLTREDAALCVEHGVDGIIVSNHGGRAEDNGLSTIEQLPEIVQAVGGRIPVLIDSGFRRGTDCFKALALGASGVLVCRPYLWGLGSFGQEGVETVLAILRRELTTSMKQMGTPTLKAITSAHVQRASAG